MSGLAVFFADCQEIDSDIDPLSQAVTASLKGEEMGEILLFPLLEKCSSLSLNTPEDVIEFYRLLVSILFMRGAGSEKLDKKLEVLIRKGRTRGFWKSFALQEGYRSLTSYLFEKKRVSLEVKQLEKGGILQESGFYSLERSIPSPIENGELALICLYLGWALQDEELLQKGLKLTEFCISLCDHEGHLFKGIWIKESEYRSKELIETFALLFSVAAHLSLSSKIQVVSESIFERREGSCPFTSLFARGFQRLIEEEVPFPKIHEGLTLYDQDQSLGFLRYHYGELSLVCVASGANTGLGAIHKKGIHITSFGPHFAPLADSKCYGIFRPSNGSRDGFKDLTIESEAESFRFKGWTKVQSPSEKEWLFFDIEGEKENIQFTLRMNQLEKKTPLYFVFYISADKGEIEGEKELLPKTLNRFKGKCCKVIFKRGEESISIMPQFEGDMEVIPLAGKDHFWSADFLLAFPIVKEMASYPVSIQ